MSSQLSQDNPSFISPPQAQSLMPQSPQGQASTSEPKNQPSIIFQETTTFFDETHSQPFQSITSPALPKATPLLAIIFSLILPEAFLLFLLYRSDNTPFFLFIITQVINSVALVLAHCALYKVLIRRNAFYVRSSLELIGVIAALLIAIVLGTISISPGITIVICAIGIPAAISGARNYHDRYIMQKQIARVTPQAASVIMAEHNQKSDLDALKSLLVLAIILDTVLVALIIWGLSMLGTPAASASIGPALLTGMLFFYVCIPFGVISVIISIMKIRQLRKAKASCTIGYLVIFFSLCPIVIMLGIFILARV